MKDEIKFRYRINGGVSLYATCIEGGIIAVGISTRDGRYSIIISDAVAVELGQWLQQRGEE